MNLLLYHNGKRNFQHVCSSQQNPSFSPNLSFSLMCLALYISAYVFMHCYPWSGWLPGCRPGCLGYRPVNPRSNPNHPSSHCARHRREAYLPVLSFKDCCTLPAQEWSPVCLPGSAPTGSAPSDNVSLHSEPHLLSRQIQHSWWKTQVVLS